MAELLKKGLEPDFETARKNLKDLIGIRVVCPFEDELYQVAESLEMQKDIEIVRIKDYIKNPKKNGYKSLHLIVKTPIFLKEGKKMITVEVQLRTIAMDFWASLEHKLRYKKSIPEDQKGGPVASGMEMIYKQLITVLSDLGVTPIEAVGQEFDPNLHNAVMHAEDEGLGENIVAEEFQKGYMYRESVVRHSMVKVAN